MTKNLVEKKKEINNFFNYLFQAFTGRTEDRCGSHVKYFLSYIPRTLLLILFTFGDIVYPIE